jgi:hypothetical protein
MFQRMSRRAARRVAPAWVVLLVLSSLFAGACGGADAQDENEPEGTWRVEVLDASFPGRQRLADEVQLKIRVRNADTRTIPNLAVTVDGFSQRKESPGLADANRPVWVVDKGPVNADTAFTNTWAVGEVPEGETRTLVWNVSAVRAGTYTLRFRVNAGVDGKAKAVSPDGEPAVGSFIARVSEKTHPVNLD